MASDLENTSQNVALTTTIDNLQINPIQGKIELVRGQQVLLDRDLALLYGVDVAQKNRQSSAMLNAFP